MCTRTSTIFVPEIGHGRTTRSQKCQRLDSAPAERRLCLRLGRKTFRVGRRGSERRSGVPLTNGSRRGAPRRRARPFHPPNELGIADHDVTLDTGVAIHNPIRVIPNGAGSTLIFTVLRQPDVSPQQFDEDAKTVENDLKTLKAILEQQ
jgi:hypothetical protein